MNEAWPRVAEAIATLALLGEDEIAVELYWMADSTAALGLYLMKCGREKPDPSLPVRHTLHPYQLMFHKGRLYGNLNNLSGTKGVGYGTAKFADCNNGRGLLRKWTRLARVGSIENYKPFRRLDIPQRNAYAPTQP